ncbi:MAG: hypothetical protein H7244_09075 [Herminiimonas sp.]|nr:hypothetical protein [Herminiimonas sp.]
MVTAIDSAAIEAIEIDLFLEALYQVRGADFRGYDRAGLAYRLHGAMRECGVASISGLQDRILRSRPAAEALIRTLSLRSAGLFDDCAGVPSLRAALVPYLRSCPLPKIWIAESTSAEDCLRW